MRRLRVFGWVVGLWVLAAAGVFSRLDAQAPASAPLPEAETFFAEARARLTGNDVMQSRFSYKERSTELNLNPFGRMGTGPVVVAEVYPSPGDGLTYRRILERDGRPVPAAEIAEQDRKFRERYDEWGKQLAREGQSARDARLKKDAEMRQKELGQLAEAIDLFDFTLVGRSTWEGQPAIVVAFTPKPNAKARTRDGRLAQGFAGRAWIHEFQYEVLHVNAIAVDDVTFGYGMIARLNSGSVVEFTRRWVEGAWYPVETRFQGTGRALIFRRVVLDYRRSYYDYHPYSPEQLPDRLGWK